MNAWDIAQLKVLMDELKRSRKALDGIRAALVGWGRGELSEQEAINEITFQYKDKVGEL